MMKKKNKNQARKSITAVGAAVAAGLTPGIVTGTPLLEPQVTDINLTAADAVSINGEMYDFDDLFAMNQGNPVPVDQIVVVYGSPKAMKAMKEKKKKEEKEKKKQEEKEKKKKKDKDKKIREKEIADSLLLEEKRLEEEALERARIEAMRQDSIRQAQEEFKTVYGPPPPRHVSPEELRNIAAHNKDEATFLVLEAIMDYCSNMTDPGGPVAFLTPNGNIIRDLKMKPSHLEGLSKEIENNYAVQLTPEMMEQLGTLRRITDFIVEVITPIKED